MSGANLADQHDADRPGRRHRRALAAAAMVAAMAGAAGGAALAIGGQEVVREGRNSVSGTVSVTAPTGAPSTRVTVIEVGDVTVWAECAAYPGAGYPFGTGISVVMGVTNHGTDGVLVPFEPQEPGYDAFNWLDGGEEEAVFGAGEIVNENHPEGFQAQVWTFGLLDHQGSDRHAESATGTFAVSARVNPGSSTSGDEYGECVFSAQVAG